MAKISNLMEYGRRKVKYGDNNISMNIEDYSDIQFDYKGD